MAAKEFTPSTTAKTTVFSSTNAASVVRNAQAARVILRTVVLALSAVEDGSASFDDLSGSSRWSAAIGAACSRLMMVRNELMETSDAPPLDWPTPLALVEALDAALWHGYECEGARLSNIEVACAAEVVIDSLDALLQESAASGLVGVTSVH